MRALVNISRILIGGVILIMIWGCSSFVTFNERKLDIDDIIEMSKVEVSSDVIIRQIEATHSKFELEPEDIIMLKKEGVEDDIIEYMIETDFTPQWFTRDYSYTPFNYWYNYYYPYYSYSYPMYDYDIYHYRYGGMPFYNYWRPYVNYRDPGLVGRFDRYYPLVSPYERYYHRRYFQKREVENRKEPAEKLSR